MAGRRRGRYSREYRERMVELVRAGRTPGSLAREFEPSEQTIRNWVRRADLDEGLRSDGLTTEARKEMRRLKRDVKRLRMERDILKKSRGLVCEGERIDPRRGYAFMRANRASFPLAVMCRVLGLSTSGYHDWLRRGPSARARRDAELKGGILAKWIESGGIHGCPRIHAALLAGGERVGRKRVARLMRELGIEGVTRRRFKTGTTKRDAGAKAARDLVNRDFSAEGPDELWVADITQVRTRAGWLYLAVVLDVWSRRIVGWAMAPRMPAELVGDALRMAISTRQPKGPVIHHSDRGSQYTSLAFGERCREAGVVQSMGSVGDAYDNAMCESFFATLECELLDRRRFRTVAEARREVFSFIEGSTTPVGFTRRSAIVRRPTSRSSIMRPEANLVRRTGGAAALRLSTLVRTSGDPPSERGSGPTTPLRTGEANRIRQHQPQKPTVRESGAGPARSGRLSTPHPTMTHRYSAPYWPAPSKRCVRVPANHRQPDRGRVRRWRGARRVRCVCPLAFAAALSPAPIGPFPPPALRTGRADFPHPALRWDHASRTRNVGGALLAVPAALRGLGSQRLHGLTRAVPLPDAPPGLFTP